LLGFASRKLRVCRRESLDAALAMPNNLRAQLIETLGGSETGLSDVALKEKFGARYESLVPVINELLGENRLELYRNNSAGGAGLVYKLVDEQTASKLQGLTPEQIMVLQEIERSGNVGVWLRDIKSATNIQQQTLTKTLKVLETRNLVKSVKSVTSKTKKLYMLFHLTPAKEITGGPWYTEQEFDFEFVEELSKVVFQYIKSQNSASLGQIAKMVRLSGISKVELAEDEVSSHLGGRALALRLTSRLLVRPCS
jgi:DNA-directed RNA polymerase III subunit RPC6